MISEFYYLRRTAIKDLAAYCGFLIGFLGSAPFAWNFLSDQLETGGIVRGLWYFFGVVSVAGLACGAIGLFAGFGVGWLWERYHRWRRVKRADDPPQDPAADPTILKLVPRKPPRE